MSLQESASAAGALRRPDVYVAPLGAGMNAERRAWRETCGVTTSWWIWETTPSGSRNRLRRDQGGANTF